MKSAVLVGMASSSTYPQTNESILVVLNTEPSSFCPFLFYYT